MRLCVGFLVLSVLLVPARPLGQGSAKKYSHPGTIVDAYSRKGIMADAYAYASQTASKGPGCPTYASLLDGQKSSLPAGDFTFHIDPQNSTYLAVYCKQGYAPRTETTNDNSSDNTRVLPDPLTLYPTSVPGVSGAEVAAVAIGTDLDGLHANFQYYAKSDQVAFAQASDSHKFSDSDRSVIKVLMERSKPFSQEPQPNKWRSQEWAGSSHVSFIAMATDLNHVRSDLIYYERADEGGYFGALRSSFSPDESNAIEAIRKRPEPFGRTPR